MPLAHREVFAGYTAPRMLGSGGMGEVCLAEHPRSPRRDALKILRTDMSADDDDRNTPGIYKPVATGVGWYMQAKESLRDATLACPDDYMYRFYWQEVFGSDFRR